MLLPLACLIVFSPTAAKAPPPSDTIRYVLALQTDGGGFRPAASTPRPSLRATSAAVRVLKYNGAEVPNLEKVAAFVLSCYDAKSGGFAEPGGPPDVALTAVGVMACVELGIPKTKFTHAMDYLKAHAKTFEEVRIGAAAVEAWGVKDCPFDLAPWEKMADETGGEKLRDPKDGGARDAGSLAAFRLRLGRELPHRAEVLSTLREGQRADGGWAKNDATGSDLEATYRVMRALHLLQEKPADVAKLRAFLENCRNSDGGYGVTPGQPSTVGATYYATIVAHWLDARGTK